MNKLISVALLILVGKTVFAQRFDTATYRRLLTASKDEFATAARSVGFAMTYDTLAELWLARGQDCVYAKPTGTKNDNPTYKLALIVSIMSQDDAKWIRKNAAGVPGQEEVWVDKDYMYREWDAKNPTSGEMWYRVVIFRKRE